MSSKHPMWGANSSITPVIRKVFCSDNGDANADDDIGAITTAAHAKVGVATLTAKVNEIIDVLKTHGLVESVTDNES